MKLSITLSLILFSLLTFGQDLTEIKLSLEKLKIAENGSYESDKWYYNPEKADIKEIKKVTLNKVMPEYDFYSVYLEGYYGWHKKHSRCLVLLNSDSGKLVIIDPIWYDEISPVVIKMIIGYEFENKKELQLFTFELQEVLLTGSINLDFNNTIFTENNITFNLIETHKEEGNVWRTIEIGINKNTIESLTSTNPITEEKRIINK